MIICLTFQAAVTVTQDWISDPPPGQAARADRGQTQPSRARRPTGLGGLRPATSSRPPRRGPAGLAEGVLAGVERQGREHAAVDLLRLRARPGRRAGGAPSPQGLREGARALTERVSERIEGEDEDALEDTFAGHPLAAPWELPRQRYFASERKQARARWPHAETVPSEALVRPEEPGCARQDAQGRGPDMLSTEDDIEEQETFLVQVWSAGRLPMKLTGKLLLGSFETHNHRARCR